MSFYAINATALGISEYTGLSLLAITEHDGRYYGITADSMVELTGSDDDGTAIAAYVRTGKLGFGSLAEKHCGRAWIHVQYSDDLTLTTLVDGIDATETAAEVSTSYTVPGHTGALPQIRTVRLRLDQLGMAWSFKIANVAGGALTLRQLAVEPEGSDIDV